MPIGDDPNQAAPLDRLRDYLKEWQEASEAYKSIDQGEGAYDSTSSPEAKDLQRKIDNLQSIIDRILINHPGLWDVAVRHDYQLPAGMPPTVYSNAKDLDSGGSGGQTGTNTGGDGGSKGGADGGGGGGGGDGSGDRNRGGGGGDSSPAGAAGHQGWKLPGKKGADFEVIKYNGKIYVSYELHRGKDGKVLLRDAWRVPDNQLAAYGIKASDARQITREEKKKYAFFGSAKSIRVHGDERHPFSQWKQEVMAQYGMTGILKNREVMNILFMGYVEGWSGEAIKGAIRQTDWWQKSTVYSRRWLTELTDEDRKTSIESTKIDLKKKLRELYGDHWQQYIGDGKVDDWAHKIASGHFGLEGNPSSAMDNWFTQQQYRAEKIMGTPAQVAHDEQRQQVSNSLADPDNMFARLRDEALTVLGPNGKPDQDFLKRWARRLASGKATDAEWKQKLRQQKQALYPWLDPNETWTDRAATYKQLAERLLGATIGYDDKLLMDLEGRKPDGTRTGQAKSLYEFEDGLRNTNRFWASRTAKEEGQGISALLKSQLLGIDPGVAA